MAAGANIPSGAERVKRELSRRGWSQADLARRLEVDPGTVTKLLQGAICSPYLQREIGLVLRVDEEALWGDLWWFPRYRAARRKPDAAAV
jgi:transcriptional regulator with XRE-family HTH domain